MRLNQCVLGSGLLVMTLGLTGCPDKQADVSKEPAAAAPSAAQATGASDKSGAPAADKKKDDDKGGW